MNYKYKLGVIGAGFMSSAIVKGILESNVLGEKEIIVSDISELSLNKYKSTEISTTLDNNYLIENSEFILLAIKPQNFLQSFINLQFTDKKIISIMAGVKKAKIRKVFTNSKIARCMPNTPCSVKSGAVGIDLSDYNEIDDVEFIKKLFKSFSEVAIIDENQINAVMGVSGSSPAYFYLFIKYLVESGVKYGLTKEDALNLAVNTMIGSGKMILQSKDKTLDELIDAVCSKGGTTIEAINCFKKNNLDKIIDEAFYRCVKRAEEIENS